MDEMNVAKLNRVYEDNEARVSKLEDEIEKLLLREDQKEENEEDESEAGGESGYDGDDEDSDGDDNSDDGGDNNDDGGDNNDVSILKLFLIY